MRTVLWSILVLIYVVDSVHAQDKSLFSRYLHVKNGDTLPYRLLLPKNYNAKVQYPLIVFLHGSGEKGNDNEKQLKHGASFFLADSNRNKFPAIVVFPQCPESDSWPNMEVKTDTATRKKTFYFKANGKPTKAMASLIGLVGKLQSTYKPDRKRTFIGGLSQGGMGTFELVRRMPGIFSAAFPICGGADPATASELIHTRWWIFHGAKDDVVIPEYSENMAKALKEKGANVKLTIYPEANHNSRDNVFAEKNLLRWLFNNH